jgi:hypothetical protein
MRLKRVCQFEEARAGFEPALLEAGNKIDAEIGLFL